MSTFLNHPTTLRKMLPTVGIVFDYETSSRGPDGSPEAYYSENFGIMMQFNDVFHDDMEAGAVGLVTAVMATVTVYGCAILIGHNVGFDFRWWMHYLSAKDKHDVLTWITTGKLVLLDTQDLVYIMSGHQHKQKSLKESCELTKTTHTKSDYLGDLFSAGKTAEDADPVKLREYLDADIKSTRELAERLVDMAVVRGMNDLVKRIACAKTMTCLAEYEGLPFDPDSAYADAEKLILELGELRKLSHDYLKNAAFLPDDYDADSAAMDTVTTPTERGDWREQAVIEAFSSPKRLTAILNGASSGNSFSVGKIKVKLPDGNYKNGKPKTKTVTLEPKFRYVAGNTVDYGCDPVTSSDEASISKYLDDLKTARQDDSYLAEALKLLLKERLLEKQINTYFLPLIRAASASADGRVHHKLNTNITSTGRLSSSNPNAQNMPGPDKSTIKNHFTERDWEYVEGDFKQVEVIGLAARSRCPKLLEVLANGGDMHYNSGKVVFGWTDPSQMDKVSKRIVKGVNFGLIYGGSAAGLAKQTGVPEATCKALADAFYTSYPGVKAFQDSIVRDAASKATAIAESCKETGMPRKQFVYVCPISSRRYQFRSYPGHVWNKGRKTLDQKMSPTELKNYTVQGFATADFVPFAMYHCVLELSKGYDYGTEFRFVNTVHDSIQFQIKTDRVDGPMFAKDLARAMSAAWTEYLKVTGNNLDPYLSALPMKGEIDIGESWGKIKTVPV